jgi:hypothetical protein
MKILTLISIVLNPEIIYNIGQIIDYFFRILTKLIRKY